MINVTKLAAGATKLVVSAGVGSIIGNAVKATTPEEGLSTLKKVSIGVGSFVLGSMVADQATKYTGQQIVDLVDTFEEIRQQVAEAKAAKS